MFIPAVVFGIASIALGTATMFNTGHLVERWAALGRRALPDDPGRAGLVRLAMGGGLVVEGVIVAVIELTN